MRLGLSCFFLGNLGILQNPVRKLEGENVVSELNSKGE